MHTQLIATELSNLGFTTRITQTGVLVSLLRPITLTEVTVALGQIFGEVEFKIHHVHRNMVHVITEE